jgi:hypothetical protein
MRFGFIAGMAPFLKSEFWGNKLLAVDFVADEGGIR